MFEVRSSTSFLCMKSQVCKWHASRWQGADYGSSKGGVPARNRLMFMLMSFASFIRCGLNDWSTNFAKAQQLAKKTEYTEYNEIDNVPKLCFVSVWLVLRQAIVRQSWMQMHCRTPSGEKWSCQYFVRDRTTEGFRALRSSIAGELMQQGGNGGMFIYWSCLLILGCFNL